VEHDQARELLEGEQHRLQGLRSGFDDERLHAESEDDGAGELSHMHQHLADVGSETFEREKDFSILEQVEAELADVERALKRLDDGSYGTCEACGTAIADRRRAARSDARHPLLRPAPAAGRSLPHRSRLGRPWPVAA
jgi:RNA polymerase-binding transcription factor DksA